MDNNGGGKVGRCCLCQVAGSAVWSHNDMQAPISVAACSINCNTLPLHLYLHYSAAVTVLSIRYRRHSHSDILYSSLFAVNGSNDTIQLNNEKKQKTTTKECNRHRVHIQNSLAYEHFTITSMVTECIAANIYITIYFTVEATITKKNKERKR